MKIAIYGYGNLGRGVEAAMKYHTDCELVAVFTRRDPSTLKIGTANVPVRLRSNGRAFFFRNRSLHFTKNQSIYPEKPIYTHFFEWYNESNLS
jgi:glyceraldehyde-3-phosphate dehydrogenase/erythrose-4-phosphate dehydrogenase